MLRRNALSRMIAGIYCCLFACLHILLFHNKFFDINRTKYYALIWSSGAALVLTYALYLFEKKERPDFKACIGLIVFLAAAALGTVFSADPSAALSGSNGRYMGLFACLGCGALFVLCLHARFPEKRIAISLLIGADLCAALGLLNFFRIDPFDFYSTLTREVYRNDFISTVGNINFFSAYLCLPAGLAAGLYMREKTLKPFWLQSFILAVGGMLVARTESAFVALFAMAIIMIFRASDYTRLFSLASAGCIAAAALGGLATVTRHMEIYEGIAGTMLGMPGVMLTAGLLFLAAAIFLRNKPIHRAVRVGIPALMLTGLAAAVCALIYFSACDTQAAVPAILRMNDTWGTFRGFIWGKCLEFYANSPLLTKLFGTGPDTVRAVFTENYAEEMYRLMGIQVDNAHNEFIQLLLTTGLIGLSGYIALLVTALKRAWRNLPLLLALSAYIAQSFFNIAQPETTPVFFLLLAAACLNKKGENPT